MNASDNITDLDTAAEPSFGSATAETTRSDVLLYFFFLFINTSYYFFDTTIYLPQSLQLAASWLILFCIAGRRATSWRWYLFFPFLYVLVAYLSKLANPKGLTPADLVYVNNSVHVLFLMYFLEEDSSIVKGAIDLFTKTFLWLNLPSLPIFVAVFLNFNLPYSLIHLGGRELFYRNYFGMAIFNDYQVFDQGNFTITRLCGMFEEPGMLGTIVAMLLVANILLFPQQTKRRTLLILLGILSMSMAFYLFLIFFFVYISFQKNLQQFAYLAMVAFPLILLSPAEVKESFNNLVLARFLISEQGGLQGDSRRIQFKEQFDEYLLKSDLSDLAFGHGAKSNQRDEEAQYSSYQGIIYEAGYVGLVLVLAFAATIFIWLPVQYHCYDILILTVFPVLSLYQRPDPLLPYFQVVCASVLVYLHRAPTASEEHASPERVPAL